MNERLQPAILRKGDINPETVVQKCVERFRQLNILKRSESISDPNVVRKVAIFMCEELMKGREGRFQIEVDDSRALPYTGLGCEYTACEAALEILRRTLEGNEDTNLTSENRFKTLCSQYSLYAENIKPYFDNEQWTEFEKFGLREFVVSDINRNKTAENLLSFVAFSSGQLNILQSSLKKVANPWLRLRVSRFTDTQLAMLAKKTPAGVHSVFSESDIEEVESITSSK